MIRSLRWRLQAWHALVLLAMLVLFGGAVDILSWRTRIQTVDAELDRTAEVIAIRMRRLFPMPNFRWPPPGFRPQNPGEVPIRSPRPEPREPFTDNETQLPAEIALPMVTADLRPPVPAVPVDSITESMTEPRRPDGPRNEPRDRRPGDRRNDEGRPNDSRRDSPPPSLEMPNELLHHAKRPEDAQLYYIVWAGNGQVMEQSPNAPPTEYPDLKMGEDGLPVRIVRERDGRREIVFVSRFFTNVLVGRSLGPELDDQHQGRLRRLLLGLGVLAAGVLGGGWLTQRSLNPLTRMSNAAASISADNFSARVEADSYDRELADLAHVLNATFDRLQQSFEQQTRFTADASHELRTPLAVVLAQTQLALSRPRQPEDYRNALTSCRMAALRMRNLVDQLLALARHDVSTIVEDREPVALAEVVQETVDLLRPLAEERTIELEAELAAVTVCGNRHQLVQLVTNLLGNAIRYNKPNGSVLVTLLLEGNEAVLCVRDTGIGIPAESLPHVFDRFYRVDAARSRADGGSGLGLSICQAVVRGHQGTITIESQLDEGTAITVRLPALVETAGQ